MPSNKTWLITGAGRGMGLQIVTAALAALAAGADAIGTAEQQSLVLQQQPGAERPVTLRIRTGGPPS